MKNAREGEFLRVHRFLRVLAALAAQYAFRYCTPGSTAARRLWRP